MTFSNTERVLNNYGELFRQVYKDNNAAAGYDPSQPLMNDVSFDVQSAAGNFSIVFHLPDYWKGAEYGYKPHEVYPPKGSLLQWMEWKHIMPQMMTLKTGKTVLPSMESLEFLIRRKIWEKGTKEPRGGHTWEATERELHDRLVRDVTEALRQDVTDYINQSIKNKI